MTTSYYIEKISENIKTTQPNPLSSSETINKLQCTIKSKMLFNPNNLQTHLVTPVAGHFEKNLVIFNFLFLYLGGFLQYNLKT